MNRELAVLCLCGTWIRPLQVATTLHIPGVESFEGLCATCGRSVIATFGRSRPHS